MNRFKLFEEFLSEGIHDPGILKAFFMAGGPGSGKSFVASELFGFPKGATSSVSYSTGLKLVNNDNAFEKGLKDAGYDVGKLADYARDEETWSKVMQIRDKAKGLTKRMQDNYIGGRLGQVIDGTGKDFGKIKGMRQLYQDLGYDTYMVFVNTSLEVALERNRMRARKLEDAMVEKMWKEVQDNLGKFQKLFGSDKMLIIDNSSYENDNILDQAEKAIASRLDAAIQNPLGRRWISDNSPENKRRNQPAGVREAADRTDVFMNEGAFVLWYEDEKGKHLLGTFHNKKAAEKYQSEVEEEILDTKGVESMGMMSKDMWDKKEAPYVKESTNEALDRSLKINVAMPTSMKKFIEGEANKASNKWSNELTDIANDIITAYRQIDLDLMDNESGPEWINIRVMPVDQLTPASINAINQYWPQMSEWAKESIYSNFNDWFRVAKKFRPHYGEQD